LDKYVKERINAVYQERTLGQIYRLNDTKFTNKDVQGTFRVNVQSARAKIKNWEDAGLVKQTGTRAPEGDQGGKPSYEYSIVDARVERIIQRRLIQLDELDE
jgi:predicted transcriptional regulator